MVRMPLAVARRSVLVVIDVQPAFLAPFSDADEIVKRTEFLIRQATLLGVPIVATEQYPSRMGGTHERLQPWLRDANAPIMPKMIFSAHEGVDALDTGERDQFVLCGIETHICVNQTAHRLLERGHTVILAGDAVSSRQPLLHSLGMERLRHAGVAIAPSEAIVYEWMESAEHPQFREALKLVKEYA